jgi:hypothetical protein
LQGEQGPQGEAGPQGATGPQGPKGDQGDRGPTGESLLCFSTDQTIGNTGKYVGLGQQDGSHLGASVVTPLDNAQVTAFIVKTYMGPSGGSVSGQAAVFHDDPNGDIDGEQLTNWCPINRDPNEDVVVAICRLRDFYGDFLNGCATNATSTGCSIGNEDGLSVFIETDGGSFQGGSACILISGDSPSM